MDSHRPVDERLLGAIEIGDEGFEAAVIEHLFLLDIGMALVGEQDADAGIEEGEFAQAVFKRVRSRTPSW